MTNVSTNPAHPLPLSQRPTLLAIGSLLFVAVLALGLVCFVPFGLFLRGLRGA